MPVDEVAVLRRAKELCEQDGLVWEAEYVPVANPGGPLPKLAIVEVHRREYLTRAQEQLLKECGDGQ